MVKKNLDSMPIFEFSLSLSLLTEMTTTIKATQQPRNERNDCGRSEVNMLLMWTGSCSGRLTPKVV